MVSKLQKLWDFISHNGVEQVFDSNKARHITFTNRLVFITFLILLGLYLFNYKNSGFTFFNQKLLFGNIAAFSGIFILNRIGWSTASRLLLTLMCSVFPFYVSINNKLFDITQIDEAMYYMTRLFILATSIIPILIFSFKEKFYMTIGILSSLIPLVLFDFIHKVAGVGYYEMGFDSRNYPGFGAIAIAAYCIFITAMIFFKRMNEKFTTELLDKKLKIEKQARELVLANKEITIINKNLENVLDKRTKKILDQMVQFQVYSFKNSHELRAPLAKVMGTLNILNQMDFTNNPEQYELIKILNQACEELDIIVHDINKALTETEGYAEVKT
ncbi:histidine kinase dimerization/phospho-acceptor domain-containing protein [Ekhidna sp.]|uniref:histidine kinase dimerization/phospho-acceptor domain-containing protein n=1 Tax=Ekhidna sp. TaxID=2608089 RepID=UPI003BAD065A